MDPLRFHINGEEYIVERAFDATYTLAEFLRDDAGLKGTKVMCKEGGCGACVVTVTHYDHAMQRDRTYAINSCLSPLYGMDGWKITTVEGLGNRKEGYHPIQKRIADMNGSQCGYCTPGMVMSLYGALSENASPDEQSIERALDGNLCRCTGYRPIHDAAKSFCPSSKNADAIDIEDLTRPLCPKSGQVCIGRGGVECRTNPDNTHDAASGGQSGDVKSFNTKGGQWFRASTLSQVYDLIRQHQGKNVRYVVGNTANGIYKKWYDIYIDIRNVPELNCFKVEDSGIEVGGNLTLSALITKFRETREDVRPGFHYLSDVLAARLETVAGTPIRNAGCWAGNLMMQHDIASFPSDLVPAFEALGAVIKLGSLNGEQTCSPLELLKMDMKGKIILSMVVPPLKPNEHYDVIRVTPRAGNAHTFVTGAFRMEVDEEYNIIGKPRVAYVGISKNFTRASKTEAALKGKSLLRQSTLEGAFQSLQEEAIPDVDKVIQDMTYKQQLARNLLYKFILRVCEPRLPAELAASSGLPPLPVTSSSQDFQTDESQWPVTQPMPKLASRKQASGEAQFADDLPKLEKELVGIFIPSPAAKAKLDNIDTTEAMKVPGVYAVYTAKDIPGRNFFGNPSTKLLADGRVDYASQPVAVLLADCERTARRAGRMVKIELSEQEDVIVDLKTAVEKEYFLQLPFPIKPVVLGDTEEALSGCEHVLEGESYQSNQFHFYLENQSAVCVPTEEGMDITCASQHPDGIQNTVAGMLGIKANTVKATVNRVGGGFGGKSAPHATALAALGAYLSGRPVRLNCSLKNAIESLGKRFQMGMKYKVGFSSDGKMKALVADLYVDMGYAPYVPVPFLLMEAMNNVTGCYHCPNVTVRGHAVKTDRVAMLAMRAPTKLPIANIMEIIVEHMATELKMDYTDIKFANIVQEGQKDLKGMPMFNITVPKAWSELMESAEIEKRKQEVEDFNKTHRWVKRGLAVTPAKYAISYNPLSTYPAYVAIYGKDGSIAVAHGGVELGQGIHTKVAQIAAKTLDVPLELIQVKATETMTGNNGGVTAISLTSEMACRSVQECCKILRERIQPIRDQMRGAPWTKVVASCLARCIDLCATHRHFEPFGPARYSSFGVGAAEAEVDILTGESRIRRLDVVFDVGESINPDIDIGQVEGALMIGLGYQLYEREVYDPTNGRVVTNTTWDYKPPSNLDIPQDMRIKLLKDAPNKGGVLPTKAVGEPPICMTPAFLHAVKRAVEASRADRNKDALFTIAAPGTPDNILNHCAVTAEELVLE